MFSFLNRDKGSSKPLKSSLKSQKGAKGKTQKSTYDPDLQNAKKESSKSGMFSFFDRKKDTNNPSKSSLKTQKSAKQQSYQHKDPDLEHDDPLLHDPGHQHLGESLENPATPASVVAETDPLLGKVDAYMDDEKNKPEKLKAVDMALLGLTWLTFIVVTTAYFSAAVMMVVWFFISHPFATFSVITTLIFLSFLGVVFTRKRWVKHMFLLCPLAAGLGVIAGIGVLCYNGALLHYYEEGRTYTNVFASQPAVQFADAGVFLFEGGETAVDTTRHISFLDRWSGTRYCVAPVIDDKMSNTDPINFWVVGEDCCDMKSFHCHELDGYSSFRKDVKKTALVIPHAAEIAPISWLAWLVHGAGQHEKYRMALNVAHSRLGAEPAEGAFLLRWSLAARLSIQALSERVSERVFHSIIVFAVIAALFAFCFVRNDHVRGKRWPKFNPRKALNRRSYHHGLADEI